MRPLARHPTDTPRPSVRGPGFCRGVQHEQLRADHQLIETIRAGEVTDEHPDPLARFLARWRTSTHAGT
jgi:hypothetical protein